MDKTFFEQPNEHYFDRLMRASDQNPIVATEDIYDHRGVKLWARGRPVTLSLRERLLATKLKKPVELCLQTENGLKGSDVAELARKILDEKPTLARLGGAHTTRALDHLRGFQLSGLPYLQLSMIASSDRSTYEHAITTALIAALLSMRLNLPESTVEASVIAGLLHDAGELYVDPELMRGGRELSFEDWKAIAVHPRIGAVMLAEFGKLHTTIVRAVQEHHERLDGSGYPFGITRDSASRLGQVMMVAEVLSAILPARENPEARALLALRLVHQQFDREIVTVLNDVYHEHSVAVPNGFNVTSLTEIALAIDGRLRLCQQEVDKVFAQAALPDSWVAMAAHARELCNFLSMSLHSTGVLTAVKRPAAELQGDPSVANELHVIVTELKWRMRALSRHIALTVSKWERASDLFQGVIESLYLGDGAAATTPKMAEASKLAA